MANLDSLRKDSHRLSEEAEIVYRQIVLPGWGGTYHGLPSTLYGYVMSAFAQIDLFSAHWQGNEKKQSDRMVAFLTKFMKPDDYVNSLAVQMWRHKLMHTGSPRMLFDEKSGSTIRWLLHWGDEHLPREQHFTFVEKGTIFNMSLFGLLDGIGDAVMKYSEELTHDVRLAANFGAMENSIKSYKLKT